MKPDIHPTYVVSHVKCACGTSFETRAAAPDISVDICSTCHPFYTGQQRLVDTAGQVDRFERRRQKSRG